MESDEVNMAQCQIHSEVVTMINTQVAQLNWRFNIRTPTLTHHVARRNGHAKPVKFIDGVTPKPGVQMKLARTCEVSILQHIRDLQAA